MFYDILGQEIVDFQHCYQRTRKNYLVSCRLNAIGPRRSCYPGIDHEDYVNYHPYDSQSHGLLGVVLDSDKDDEQNKEDSSERTHPAGSITEHPLDLKADETEVEEDYGEETQPVDNAIGNHVLVIPVEMGQNALFHVLAPAQMGDDQRGSVVRYESH